MQSDSIIKIVHIITGLGSGGAETMLFKLLSKMDASRFCNTVISLTAGGKIARDIQQLGITVHALNLKPGVPHPIGLWRLVKMLRANRPDMVQTWLYHSDLLGLLGGKLSGVHSIAWNVRCSQLKVDDHSNFLFGLLRLLAAISGQPNAVIVNSEAGRQVHEKLGYKPKRWIIIPNGFDTNIFRPSSSLRVKFRSELGLSEDSSVVGMVARFHAMKDHVTFLRAASMLIRQQPDVRFVLAGQGVEKANSVLMQHIRELQLEDAVFLLGEREDMPKIMASLDAMVSSSYSEGFPNVIGEAMACGVPCVVTDVGDSAYLVGETGFIVQPSRPEVISDALNRLLSMDIGRRREMGLAARARIKSLFSIEKVAQQYERFYEEICEKNIVKMPGRGIQIKKTDYDRHDHKKNLAHTE